MANQKRVAQSFDSMIKYFLKQYNFATRQDIDRLAQKLDSLEKKISATKHNGNTNEANKNNTKNGSASDMVIDAISGIGTGANFADIQEKTQFDDKKLRNIIYRLNKQGKIRRKKRGVYIPL